MSHFCHSVSHISRRTPGSRFVLPGLPRYCVHRAEIDRDDGPFLVLAPGKTVKRLCLCVYLRTAKVLVDVQTPDQPSVPGEHVKFATERHSHGAVSTHI